MSFALISRFADTLDELERTWRATARFVPDQFLSLLGRRRITEVQRGDSTSRDITVMFCAIPGFGDTTQGWTSEQSFAFLNRFLAAMEPCIHDNGGFVAQYLGDGFLAMFPVGGSRPVDAAVALQEAARVLEPAPGQQRVKIAIGLHTGPVMLGTVGSEERLTTGQVSDVVNTSSRVKGLTAHYGAPIVISEATRALAMDDGWALHELDAVVMKGKVEPVRAFEVLSGEPDLLLRRFKESEARAYGEGLAAFRAGDLERARSLFARLAERWVAARLFVQRCDWFLVHGLPDRWDGVIRMTVK
jgi:two-component system sensor histidine kinase ChiS